MMNGEKLIHTFTQDRSRLMRFARNLLGNSDDAEDALQEAFCRLWPRAELLKTDLDANRLALTTVKNVSIDNLRKRRTSGDIDKVDISTNDNIEESIDRKKQLQIVDQIINSRLSPQQQRIFKLHDVEGMTYEDIAKQEHMLEATVRKQLSRARKTIRECYQNSVSNER